MNLRQTKTDPTNIQKMWEDDWSVKKQLPEQEVTFGEEEESPQREGRLRALWTSMANPSASGWPKSSHKQMGLLSTSPAISGQHPFSGFVRLLSDFT